MTNPRSDELSKKTLADDLKHKLGIEQDLNFEQLVDFGLKKQGKEAFVPWLNRIMNYSNKKVPEYYKTLTTLGIKYVVETHYSSLFRLEVAESEDCRKYKFYNRDDDFLFHEDAQIFISLFGNAEYNKEKLILSQNDFNGFFSDSNSISSSLRSIFKNTILFIDFDPTSDRFKRIYDFICQRNGQYPSEAFLVTSTHINQLSYGSAENLTVICSDAYEYLDTLAFQLSRTDPIADSTAHMSSALPQVPYKYLHSFEQTENAVFFGREKEISELFLRVRGAKQITMLTSLSGYGKTSMINAGLIPALRKTNDYDIYYVRSGNDPWKSIVRDAFHEDPQSFSLDALDILHFSVKKYQLVIVDQFEECFINTSQDSLNEIDARMNALLDRFPTISLLISIRQDFFTYLTKFKFLSEAQINSTYYLNPLNTLSALDAIIKPTSFEKYNFSYENGLADQIVNDLSVQGDGGIPCVDPSQLQIVCYFLYQELQNRNELIISAEIYNELGKANGILENYIDESLKRYDDKRQLLGKEILKCLVSSMKTRISKSSQEICLEMMSNSRFAPTLENEVKYMLDNLVNARLVQTRTISEGKQVFELTHEYIIRKINEWMDAETLKFKEVCELFRVEYRKWFLYKTIMPLSLYEEVQKYRNRIDFRPEEKSYLLLCLISYAKQDKDAMKYWISQNKGNPYCETDLIYAISNFKSKKRIFSGILLSVLCPEDRVFKKIYDFFSENINPHLLEVEKEIRNLGEEINEGFLRNMQNFLNRARAAGMCPITSNNSVRLGLSSKDRDSLVKKFDLGNKMKPFFPKNVRTVSLSFYQIDMYTVTNKQYAEFDENFHYDEEYENYPVVGINFEQASAYAHWWGKDLPTEDEWEYAARGGDFRFFPWGDDWDYEAELKKEEADKRCNTSLTGTDGARSVNEYPKGTSPFGCFNMSGNVWEWTKTRASESIDRLIVKGGSWSQLGIMPWTWYRYSYSPKNGYQNVGFRCVLRG